MQWVVSVLSRHTRPDVRGESLRPRLIGSGEEALLAVFNDSRTERRQESIAVPDRYTRALDIYSGRELDLRAIPSTAMTQNQVLNPATSEYIT